MLWKLGVYRTDNAGTVGQPNAASTRPFNILYFSDFYFVAAEAAVKGATTQSGYTEADFSQQMMDATPATITIDYILDELSREYFGEGRRWLDLVRTQTWRERAGSYTICGMNADDVTPVTYERDIPDGFYLRPIPKGQLDAMEMTDAEREAFQNPAYR